MFINLALFVKSILWEKCMQQLFVIFAVVVAMFTSAASAQEVATAPECAKYLGGPYLYDKKEKFEVISCEPAEDKKVVWTIRVINPGLNQTLSAFNNGEPMEVIGGPTEFTLKNWSGYRGSWLKVDLKPDGSSVTATYKNDTLWNPIVVKMIAAPASITVASSQVSN